MTDTSTILTRPAAIGEIARVIDRATVAARSHGPVDTAALEAAANALWALRETLIHEEREAQNRREQAAHVTVRMQQVWAHIEGMRSERQGWGDDAQRGIDTTVLSWAKARALYLDPAEQVWCDGGSGLSFGGVIGGIVFGCIVREEVERGFAPEDGWTFPTLTWSFHS